MVIVFGSEDKPENFVTWKVRELNKNKKGIGRLGFLNIQPAAFASGGPGG